MTPLFDLPVLPVNDAAGEDLRAQVHRHLMRHPGLTVAEIAHALNLDGTGKDRVRRQLALMKGDGEAERVPGNPAGRAAVRWIAT